MPETTRIVTIAHRWFRLERRRVERAMRDVLPDPVTSHYVVIGGRRTIRAMSWRGSRATARPQTACSACRRTRPSSPTRRRSEVPVHGAPGPEQPAHARTAARRCRRRRPRYRTQACLLDTGATATRFGGWLADTLGLDLTGSPTQRIAIGATVTEGRMAEVSLRVADHSWRAPVWFCEPWLPAFGLLGLAGFFDHFLVTIAAHEGWIELEAVE